MDRDNEDRFERSGVGSRPVETRGADVRVRRGGNDVGVREAHRRFGGIDVPAAVAGTLAALGMSVLLGGLLAAAGLLRYGDDVADTAGAQDETALATGAAITALLIALLSTAFGAWVAGRMARYDGGRNGILTAVLYVLALAGLSAAGLGLRPARVALPPQGRRAHRRHPGRGDRSHRQLHPQRRHRHRHLHHADRDDDHALRRGHARRHRTRFGDGSGARLRRDAGRLRPHPTWQQP
jgi:hypothetical protein